MTSVRDLLPRRQVPLPPPVIRIDPFTPVYDCRPLGDSEGRAPWRGPYGPDPLVFGKPYTPVRESTPGHWRARHCACGARWHSDGETPCWACEPLSVLASEQASVVTSPRLDSLTAPDLAHVKGDLGRGEVLAVHELLDALTAHAEHAADLCRPDQVMHVRNHSHDASGHLTRGQEHGRLVT